MTGQITELSKKTGELLDTLKVDVERIERAIENLNTLRCIVIKRDERGLCWLLETIKSESAVCEHTEQKRNQIRKDIAELIGCPEKTMTLSVLKKHLSNPELIEQICNLQQKLKTLVLRLKNEYTSTFSLLSDCARINSALLRCIFSGGKQTLVCYNSTGDISKQNDAAFMSMRM